MLKLKKIIFTFWLRGISLLPFSWLRTLGSIIGRIGLNFSKKASNRLNNNLLITGFATPDTVKSISKQTAGELGKTLIETICVAWLKEKAYCDSLVKHWQGFDLVLEQERLGHPLVFLTPHIGNFEIAIKATFSRLSKPITVLYKPSKNEWFHHLMLSGRTEDNIKPVPTTSRGVMALVKALRRSEAIGVLPDSVASQGDGVWVEFFNHKVFATTLSAKMAMVENAATFVVGSYRVKGGFDLEFIPYIRKTDDITIIVQNIYGIIEGIISKAPTQYFWSYDRFRTPDHARG